MALAVATGEGGVRKKAIVARDKGAVALLVIAADDAALRFTEPAENFDHQHQDLRTENGKVFGDTIDHVDFRYVANVTKVNGAAMASLALGAVSAETSTPRVSSVPSNTRSRARAPGCPLATSAACAAIL